jgi:hypothetical protein
MELARDAANKAVEEKTRENKKLVSSMKEIVNFFYFSTINKKFFFLVQKKCSRA